MEEPARAGIYAVHVSCGRLVGKPRVVRRAAVRARGRRELRNRRRRGALGAAAAPPSFAVGAGLDDPSQAATAQKLGLRLVRFGVAWPAGATAPDPGLVAALQRVPAGLGDVVELNAGTVPADTAGRAALAPYAASLVQQVPATRSVVLAPAPSTATAAAYAATLAQVRDAVAAAAPAVATGPLIDGAVAPKTVATSVARALAVASVAPPYAGLVALRPAPTAGKNLWTAADAAQLVATLRSTWGDVPPVVIDGLAAPTGPAQATTYARAIAAVACSTTVGGVILDRLVDSADATIAPTGVIDATGSQKPAAAAVASAAAAAQRGLTVCPGLAAPVTATTLTFPAALTPPEPATVALACDRDCLYLATLVREDGTPVVATRGSLTGGVARTVGLPRTTLKPGAYRVDVRLVAQVNPGPVTRETSDPLVVG